MWSQPTRTDTPSGRGYATVLTGGQWAVLVGLPPRVLAATLALRAEPPAVDEALSGLAAIAAARSAGGALVREVVAAIFAAHDDEAAIFGGQGPPETLPAAVTAERVLADCAAVGQLLADRVPAGEAEEYRRWVLHVATVARGSGRGTRDDPLGAAQLRLLAGCERALAG